MMYVVETLAPRFFVHQEKIFLSANESSKVIHSSMHKETELEHADEAEKLMAYVDRDESLMRFYIGLWRDMADEMKVAMYHQNGISQVTV